MQASTLNSLATKYRQTPLVKMSVEKIVKSEVLDKETIHEGRIFVTKNKFRWENDKPEKTLLVFDGKTIWSEQTPAAEFGGPVQVAKGAVNKSTGNHVLISSLIGADLTKNFTVKKESTEGSVKKIQLTPTSKDLAVKDLTVFVDAKKNELQEVSYLDDIGNKTRLKFSKIEFVKKANDKLFKYQPPKGAQVTNL